MRINTINNLNPEKEIKFANNLAIKAKLIEKYISNDKLEDIKKAIFVCCRIRLRNELVEKFFGSIILELFDSLIDMVVAHKPMPYSKDTEVLIKRISKNCVNPIKNCNRTRKAEYDESKGTAIERLEDIQRIAQTYKAYVDPAIEKTGYVSTFNDDIIE